VKLPSVTLPKLPERTTSPKRVFYGQPSGVKPDLLALYQRVAKDLDVTPAQVRAFAIVESDEKPFTPGGNPVVRFEAARWRKYRIAEKAALAFDNAKNSKDLDVRWAQFEKMRAVNEQAAIMSHSFGIWQVMGFNYARCLCADPVTFLNENMAVEGQFKMFKRFVLSSPNLLAALRKGDAEKVAYHYNGPGYAANKYDVKWAAATKSGGESVWA